MVKGLGCFDAAVAGGQDLTKNVFVGKVPFAQRESNGVVGSAHVQRILFRARPSIMGQFRTICV
jgi:hypothetical protein